MAMKIDATNAEQGSRLYGRHFDFKVMHWPSLAISRPDCRFNLLGCFGGSPAEPHSCVLPMDRMS